MVGSTLCRIRKALVSSLGVTILLGAPLPAQADQGKWWNPKEGGRRVETREHEREWNGRGSWGGWSGRGSRGGYRSWRGIPVRRDVIVIRDHRYGRSFRARRIFVEPRFHGGCLYVRPVRYFIAADACIGGFNIRARIVRPHYLYGCNFCDARFDSYDAYAAHVVHCDHGPDGYAVHASNWDDGYDMDWDGPYHADDENDQDYDG